MDESHLKQVLTQIDGMGYKSYKEIQGKYIYKDFELFIDHVQGDPFAHPSKIRLRVQQKIAKIPDNLWVNSTRKLALEDFMARNVREAIHSINTQKKGSGKSGLIFIDAGNQEVIERTAFVITKDWIEARIQVGLPANGRTILGLEAIKILCNKIPKIIEQSFKWKNLDQNTCIQFVDCIENQEHLRNQLVLQGLVAFIANGSILPRASGISNRPLNSENVIEFQSPKSLETSFELKNPLSDGKTVIHGMGIPKGVILIVGGGYHGKSTLLKALERCVYPHVPGDGREYVITNPDAVKIRAEDGRRIEKVNIDSFITNLPQGVRTDSFCTDDASGSTSQAANIIEAIEVGCNFLLLDEDTSAANFMIRDARMQQLVQINDEPITPFVDRIRELYEVQNVSTILVMGGSGDYFDVADTVIKMKDYLPYDVSTETKMIVKAYPSKRQVESIKPIETNAVRIPSSTCFKARRGTKEVKIDTQGNDKIIYGNETIDLRFVDQLVENSQIRAVGHAIYLASQFMMRDCETLKEIIKGLDDYFDKNGLDSLDPFYEKEKHPGNFSRPRKYEIAATINRMRTLTIN
ncbi:MAG: ABC-ATPase domain-containing protein [Candidatus Marinimicrobia bacterium]|jgi:predicted ABC-class ATPase|nr:ABC-ATPase domain-containing protein [Candidatus Neomarinimicrobiota bacterium]MBT3501042.1 ABC-ATPase domain-containing protein [Candidatus Neomarinimicrobiota bacterium]MBT3838814.1 ABC-ATPase domain-containing protein [Candidatus Neomarinimicrobiota bacterium]MBT3998791.1 ABC-ATPase domain-containing protein [Candidatus Neomarinimicrobiota bacterium]MBT4282649.1 ABC-ATPase domain-containing protein [Candidatus Neomarinimicrobiota bacterium]